MTIDGWVHHWAAQRPGTVAVRHGPASVTYRQLAGRVLTTASALAERGIGPGDRVAFCALNRVEYLDLLFGCARLGAILVPLNNRLTEAEHRFQLDDADPALVLGADGFADQLRRAAPDRAVVDLDREPLVAGMAGPSGPLRPTPAAGSGPGPRWLPDTTPLLMVYTSGTTGRPKGAVHTQRSLLFTVLNGVAHQDLSAADVVLTFLPLFHVGGLNVQTLPALYAGGTVELVTRFDPDLVLRLIRERRPTQTLAVPTTLAALVGHPDFAATDLGCLRGVNSGSSVVPTHLIRALLDRGVPVGQVYGATETGPTAVVLRYDDGAAHLGLCGKAALHTELRLADLDDPEREVGSGAPGELQLRGDHLFAGYWRNPAASAAAFTADGWYRTGDVGRCDAEGFVFVEDRLKDMLISGGENVYPAEVENVLAQHPAVAEVAVVGRADTRWGEVPVACVVPAGDTTVTIEELRAWCGSRLAPFKHPRDLVVLASLPRTALGKVTKHTLRAGLGRADDGGLDVGPAGSHDGATQTEGRPT